VGYFGSEFFVTTTHYGKNF